MSLGKIKFSNLLMLGSIAILILFYNNCAKPSASNTELNAAGKTSCLGQLGTNKEWSNEVEIPIVGYTGNAMEPQISADGVVLLFNNKTGNDNEMDIHFAVKQTDGSYAYGGVLAGANVAGVLDGVPATDSANNFYFMSTRNYGLGSPPRYRTLFGAQFSTAGGLSLINIAPADASFPNGQAPEGSTFYVDMDLGLSWDGTKAIVARTSFSESKTYPDFSRLELFNVHAATRSLSADSNSETILKNINLEACRVYAPTLSTDQKELFYTVLSVNPDNTFDFRIVVAKRSNTAVPFGKGSIIKSIMGQTTEGPSISYHDGGKTLYYHRLDSLTNRLKIYKVTRP